MAEDDLIHSNEKKVKKPKVKQKIRTDSPPIDDSGDITSQSRARFEQLLQENLEVSPLRETKKKKKKKPASVQQESSEELIGESFQTNEDASLSGASPELPKLNFHKTPKEKQEKQSTVFTEDQSGAKPESAKKTKQKKIPLDLQEQEINKELTTLIGEKKTVRKKKKPKKTEDEVEEVEASQPKDVEESDETKETVPKTGIKKKPRKKVKSPEPETKDEDIVDLPSPSIVSDIKDDGHILAVTIHRTDKLKNDFSIVHPMVRVHVIDEDTGKYLLKQNSERPVTSYYENTNSGISYILPIMTQPFDFKQRKSTLPVWEELLLFNENYNYFVQSKPKVILFFEILDFVSMTTASFQYQKQKQEGGWYKIAWAFLKVVGANQKLNTGSKVRLQLFQPSQSRDITNNTTLTSTSTTTSSSHTTEIYDWWKNNPRINYPSTLYVTVKQTSLPEKIEPSLRSMFAVQEEKGISKMRQLQNKSDPGSISKESYKSLPSWSRLAGQTCRVPNSLLLTLKAGRNGCYTIKFSKDGRSLACGCSDLVEYPVLVYEIPSGQLSHQFTGHFGIIYDISWSKSNTHLCSASADGTVRVWNKQKVEGYSEKLLPHPSYVYSCCFHVKVDTLVVTGGYDQIIRIWDIQGNDQHGQLMQEIESHKGHINSLCFDELGEKMYSGDSVGALFVWNCYVNEQPHQTGFQRDWTLFKDITIAEFHGIPINCLKLHSSGRRLLVHYRDSIIRMIDLRILRVMQKYIGIMNLRNQLQSTLSPCGSFVFSGSEDNSAYVWNTESGDQIVTYSEMNYQHPVTGVDYHPRDHIVAFCSPGNNQQVYLYKYDSSQALRYEPLPNSANPKNLNTSLIATTTALLDANKNKMRTATFEDQDEFHIQDKARYGKIMNILNSVSTVTPSMFSPHAPQSLSTELLKEQFSLQNKYSSTSDPWQSGMSSWGNIGLKGTLKTQFASTGKKTLSINHGVPQFTFEATPGTDGSSNEQVIALYDYKAQRSDELTFFQGDIVTVLYKDNAQWWMGQLHNGKQGFFPANYVTEQESET